MDIDTVTIHQVIDGLPHEAEVPESTVDSWAAQGWLPGPFPRDVVDNRPPKSGRGSGFEAWLAYAAERDIVLEVGATREQIIAAVEELDGNETSPVGEITTTHEEGQP